MPVEFLTEEQRNCYGRYSGDINSQQLARFFHFSDADHELIYRHRGDHNRLGFAVQLGTVRFLNVFLGNPLDVPPKVTAFVAGQLRIRSLKCFEQYGKRISTQHHHQREIKVSYGYRDFHHFSGYFPFFRWLYIRCWLNPERPSTLFDLSLKWLIDSKVLLPGISVMERIVSQIRGRTAEKFWLSLSESLSDIQKQKLKALLNTGDGSTRQTNLDRLRQGATRASSRSILKAIDRLEEIRKLGIPSNVTDNLPSNRIAHLGRYAASVSTQTISRMPDNRKIATLAAFAIEFEKQALDEVLLILDLIVTDMITKSKRAGQSDRLRTIRDLDFAAIQLGKACKLILDDNNDDGSLRNDIFLKVSRKRLAASVARVEELARPEGYCYQKELIELYGKIRLFVPKLLRHVSFEGTKAGKPIVEALNFLKSLEGKRKSQLTAAPMEAVPKVWKRWVEQEDKVDRKAYTVSILCQLQDSLRKRDIFVQNSNNWGDTRKKLIQKDDWSSEKKKICRSLGVTDDVDNEIKNLDKLLSDAYGRANLEIEEGRAAFRFEKQNGKEKLVIPNIDKLEEPKSLLELQNQVQSLLPNVDLPEMILEVNQRTKFAEEFSHISESKSRTDDLTTSICAVLLAEACNIGIEPLVKESNPALTKSRLFWVQQNYLRAETLSRANAKLVEKQSEIPLAQIWGGGEVASADGLRFVVPVRTVNARPNPKYFKNKKGITYYGLTSNQFSGLNGIVIPGTLRDSMYILDLLLGQDTNLKPTEIMTDTAGVSDLIFGLFWLLGYRFSPRIADAGESRFWRINKDANYGQLDSVSQNSINTKRIAQNWDDMLRVAGSLRSGKVSGSELIGSLLRSRNPSSLTRAIQDLGRVPKTLYLLDYISDENYRRRILTQLNRGEGRWGISRKICYGHRGEIRKRFKEGQEDQLGAIGLVTNICILWQTIYMNEALNYLQSQGHQLHPEDIARLSPLVHKNLNVLGKYSFNLSPSVANGKMRRLRVKQYIDNIEIFS